MLGREGWTPRPPLCYRPLECMGPGWHAAAFHTRAIGCLFRHCVPWLKDGMTEDAVVGLLLFIGRRRTFDVSFWDGDGIVFVQSCLVSEVVWWKPGSTSRVWCGHYHHILLPLEQVPACMVLLCTAWLHMLLAYVRPLNKSWLASSNHHSNHIRTSHHTPLVFFSCTTLRTNRADTKRVAHWYHW